MIHIHTKTRLYLCLTIIFMIILAIIGFMCCQCDTKRTIAESERIIETDKKIEIETDREVDTNQAVEPVSLGNFKLTGYCKCSLCCGKWANNRPNGIVYGAIGEELKEGYSIAVDPSVIAYRSEVVINGHTYKAQDCGGAIKGNRIDIYFEDHQDALDFGVQYAEVFVK